MRQSCHTRSLRRRHKWEFSQNLFETFNAFNNKDNVNTVSTPILFNFDGFLRQGVGDPREAQLSLRFEF